MDYKKRTQAILSLMKNERVDWFFVTGLVNVRYLSGFTGSHGILLIGPGERYILTDGRYQEQVWKEVSEYQPVIQGNRQDEEAIRDTVGDLADCTVWFEPEHCSFSRYEKMRDILAAETFLGKKNVVESLREVKDKDEIALLRRALQVAEKGLSRAIGGIREGMTERELAHLLEDEMWRGGADKESFESLVLFGKRSSLPHGMPSNARLKRGDAVLMDFGCVVDGYCSDITRTVFFGEPDDEFKRMYDLVLEANCTVEEKIKAGVHDKQADDIARQVFKNSGKEEFFVHGLGHGVGLEIHEAPRLSQLAEGVLQTGNIVTIEPGLYVPDYGGIRIEDMVVVRDGDCELLNQSSKDLIVI